LKDESTLESLDIKEKDFLVVTLMKKAAPKPAPVQDAKPPEPVSVEQKPTE